MEIKSLKFYLEHSFFSAQIFMCRLFAPPLKKQNPRFARRGSMNQVTNTYHEVYLENNTQTKKFEK